MPEQAEEFIIRDAPPFIGEPRVVAVRCGERIAVADRDLIALIRETIAAACARAEALPLIARAATDAWTISNAADERIAAAVKALNEAALTRTLEVLAPKE